MHPSQTGRICTVETSEGQNAGLVSAMSFAVIPDGFGILRAPFFRVHNGNIIRRPTYLDSYQEEASVVSSTDRS
eukprot:12413337-Karenia_brevis.AAC.1